MLSSEPAGFIETFVENLNECLKIFKPDAVLSKIQMTWLSICLTGILLTNSICWAKFERTFLGKCTVGSLSWMFRMGKISWNYLMITGVKLALMHFGISEGCLVLDETDRSRCKSTKRIHKAHKQKDKATGGYVNGQTIILLLLMTESLTIPVGFVFYQPDPLLSAWNKKDDRLKKQGVPKEKRPPEPQRSPAYPTKLELALQLLSEFAENHSEIRITAIIADALYGKGDFMDKASLIFDGVQTISQLRKNQNIFYKGKKRNLEDYFNSTNPGVETFIVIRGGEKVQVTMSSARLKVDAHGKKRFVIALKYEGEEEYRYLVATDMSWRGLDIAQAYTLRWLVEVFFEDWKLYEGWGREARQFDEEGAVHGLILSLLFDLALLLHPEQTARLENKLPAYTVGSLQRLAQVDSLLDFIKSILQDKNPDRKLKEVAKLVKDVFKLTPSGKHMAGRDLGRLEPTPALQYKM
jgi:hypothetical protein